MGTEKNPAEDKGGQNKEEKKNFLEWAVFAIGLLLVLSVVSYLGYKTFTYEPTPPEIEVNYWADPSEGAPFRYAIEVSNNGGETAEEVTVELVQKTGDATIETAALKLSFVPRDSKREGWLNFHQDPKMADTLLVRVVSYKRP